MTRERGLCQARGMVQYAALKTPTGGHLSSGTIGLYSQQANGNAVKGRQTSRINL